MNQDRFALKFILAVVIALAVATSIAKSQIHTNIEKCKRIYIGKTMRLDESSVEYRQSGLLFDFKDYPKGEYVELHCINGDSTLKYTFPYALEVGVDGPNLWMEYQGEKLKFYRID